MFSDIRMVFTVVGIFDDGISDSGDNDVCCDSEEIIPAYIGNSVEYLSLLCGL